MPIRATTRISVSRMYPSSPRRCRCGARRALENEAIGILQFCNLVIEKYLSQGFKITQLLNLICYPWVSGMLCGGPLPTTSWMSTDVGEIFTTL